jgi:hypothetical protein
MLCGAIGEIMKDKLISESKGASIFRGMNCMDGDEWTLDQAARSEAYSRQCAINSRMQTTVSPSNGVWVSWDEDHDTEAKAEFDRLVEVAMLDEAAASA